jgi:5-formyltetrahydrofolate cyclo-ligase
VKAIKLNLDAFQRWAALVVLERGSTVGIPASRRKDALHKREFGEDPEGALRGSSRGPKGGGGEWDAAVALQEPPRIGLGLMGSMAMIQGGRRLGAKAMAMPVWSTRSCGSSCDPAGPVATIVLALRPPEDIAVESHDLLLCQIVTAQETIKVFSPPAPEGIAWDKLAEAVLAQMRMLAQLGRCRPARLMASEPAACLRKVGLHAQPGPRGHREASRGERRGIAKVCLSALALTASSSPLFLGQPTEEPEPRGPCRSQGMSGTRPGKTK